MDTDPQSTDILCLLQKHWLPVGLGCIGLLFLGYGLIEIVNSSNQKHPVTFIPAENASAQKTSSTIVVDVSGAVVRPGVYTLSSESRMHDALIAAGGMSEAADRIAVAKQINLAAPLTDAVKIYIPFVGEVIGSEMKQGSSLININQATESSLDSLPGIGKVTAQKIISNRPYQKVEDLLLKKIVSQKVFEEVKDKVSAF